MTDAELVERARQGQTDAFGELVERHRHAIVRAAYAALGNGADADDAAQDACVLAYQRLAQFRGESSFKTWLIAITWRTAITRRRSWVRWAQRQLGRVASADTTSRVRDVALVFDRIPAAGRTPEQALIDGDRVAMVRRLIEALPAKLREAILLAASGEMSSEEAARMIEVPVGTFKWRVSEARRQLREKLQRLGYEYE